MTMQQFQALGNATLLFLVGALFILLAIGSLFYPTYDKREFKVKAVTVSVLAVCGLALFIAGAIVSSA